MEEWRKPPSYYPEPTYRKIPPNPVEKLAHILMRFKHGILDYEPCPCCTYQAQAMLPELEVLFKKKL
jgi:hypothetical protein